MRVMLAHFDRGTTICTGCIAVGTFVVGAVAMGLYSCKRARRWWYDYIARGFEFLMHVDRYRPVRGPDIQVAFHPELIDQREAAMAGMSGDGKGPVHDAGS